MIDVRSAAFNRFAAGCAFVAGLGGLAYSVAFAVLLYGDARDVADRLSAGFLMAGGLLSAAVFVALRERLRATDEGLALLGLVLGVAGGLGSAVHGAYELAVLANPPHQAVADLPNAVDPRGFLTFGVTALAMLTVCYLILRGSAFPRGLGWLAGGAAVLLTVIYVGRLTVLNPKSPVLLVSALLTGFVVSPALYVWVGLELRRGART